ncbi:MAG: hypothetical protein GYA51_02850 [Candidatus Methanofastidiosa archaeon]|nr:hypothetical protein [Candidatus Methanofastidiosa archaeon]
MMVFVASHFKLSDLIFGGIINFIIPFALIIWSLQSGGKIDIHQKRDWLINLLLILLVISNCFGWMFKSKLQWYYLLVAIVNFCAFIIMFRYAKSMVWLESRMKILVEIICIMSVYALITAVINGFDLLDFETPLITSWRIGEEDIFIFGGRLFFAMVERPSGEMGLIYFSFLFPIATSNQIASILRINRKLLWMGTVSACVVCLIAFSKSQTILLVISSILLILAPNVLSFKFLKSRIKPLFILLSLSIVIIISNAYFNYGFIFQRFKNQPKLIENFFNNPLEAAGTSREVSYTMGISALKRENWWIGYGYAMSRRNKIAYFGSESAVKSKIKLDFHNLYYSLPPVMGWVGGFAFISLFLIFIIRGVNLLRSKRVRENFRAVFLFAFINMMVFFLLGEWTINAITSPHYLMMIMILLGLAYSMYYDCLRVQTGNVTEKHPF